MNQHTSCPTCRTPSYSKKAINWLIYIMKSQNNNIVHAENGGEHTLLGTNLKVDGYCPSTNTVYEFHGDIFHGNPKKFNKNQKCSPYHNMTAGQLYKRTKQKEKTIKKLGYNLITIWESDYDKQYKRT